MAVLFLVVSQQVLPASVPLAGQDACHTLRLSVKKSGRPPCQRSEGLALPGPSGEQA